MMARGGREKASQRLNPNRKTTIICPTFVRYVMQEIALMNPDLGASPDYEIFSRIAVVEQRGGMLTVRAFRRIGYVVSRCKAPYAIPTDKTEVLGMVILVVAYYIEHHPSIHFLNLHRHHDGI